MKGDKNLKKENGASNNTSPDHLVTGILKMFEGLPDDIKDLFIPQSADELFELEFNSAKFKSREADREKVRAMQTQHKLPLRPNESLRRTKIMVRIAQFKRKK